MTLLKKEIRDTTKIWIETIKELRVDDLLGIDISEIAEYITTDISEIKIRQDIFIDCAKIPEIILALEKIMDAIDVIQDILRKEKEYVTDIEKTLYSVKSLGIYIEIVTYLTAVLNANEHLLCSTRLKEFFYIFHDIAASESFITLSNSINAITYKANDIKSFTIAVNLNAQLEPAEIGILSINNEYFSASNVYTRFFGKDDTTLERATPLVKYDNSDKLLERSLYLTINRHLCKAIKKTYRGFLSNVRDMISPLFENYNDIKFICRANKFIKRLIELKCEYCYPEPDSSCTLITSAYDPMLLNKLKYYNIVGNDVEFNKNNTSIYVLTGINSGGKSVYLRSIGVNQILYQLGLCVTAKKAHMKVVNALFTHFPTEYPSTDSRFVMECQKMKCIIDKMDGHSLVLMDETFSSTNSSEGAAVAFQVLKHIQAKSCWCIYSTHIHEIRPYIAELNKKNPKAEFLYVDTQNGRRTFTIKHGFIDELSYAYEIAKKFGLEFSDDDI